MSRMSTEVLVDASGPGRGVMSTYDRIEPIIRETYGKGKMAASLAGFLAEKIDAYDGDRRERMVMDTCWNWFAGGTTAEAVARKIEAVIR